MPPPEPPCVPLPGVAVPVDGGDALPPLDGVGVAAGVPELGVPVDDPPDPFEPDRAFLFFVESPGDTGSPLVTGGTTG